MVEGIIYRYRCGIRRRDVPDVFGPWQTIRTWHRADQRRRDLGRGADPVAVGRRCRRQARLDRRRGFDDRPRPSTRTNITRLTGGWSNYTNPRIEPPDHGIGRSRGGLTTKIHHLVDGTGRPLVVLVSAGQANDPVFEHLMAHLRVNKDGRAWTRTRPERIRADKAYSGRAIRSDLRRRGITAVIPEPSDQIPHRKEARFSRRTPATFDADDYKRRNVIERGFNTLKQWRGLATRYDKLAIVYRADRRGPTSNHHLDSPFIRHALAQASGLARLKRVGQR
jgi:transposase